MDMGTTGFDFESLDWNAAFPELPLGVASAWDEINYPHPDEHPVNEGETFDEDEESIDSSDGDKDEVISQISERMGSLQVTEDGEFRYFGATSNLNLLDEVLQQNHFETEPIRSRGREREDNARLSQHVDSALIAHLISLYFAWQDPAFHVVDRRMYEEKRKLYESGTDDSTFYSETLTHSMCALGALYETRRHPHLPAPLSEFFSAKAKIWLEVELDSPRVATIQALVIMSSYEAACTRDARGWLYSGMSMRLALDLGLHTDMTPYVQNGQMSSEEAQTRGVAFWGSFIVDQ
ncbi:putative nitrogen assimilation transcription factor nit-4 [Leptodontidium sp. 2 PMI_412]|nr:putative nitrogen assimilation transcription factor nit-4 [Leptodontidium sp. 2 PMI_412]